MILFICLFTYCPLPLIWMDMWNKPCGCVKHSIWCTGPYSRRPTVTVRNLQGQEATKLRKAQRQWTSEMRGADCLPSSPARLRHHCCPSFVLFFFLLLLLSHFYAAGSRWQRGSASHKRYKHRIRQTLNARRKVLWFFCERCTEETLVWVELAFVAYCIYLSIYKKI